MTNLLYPAIPAVDKLLLAHTPVPRDVEDHKQVADLLGVHPGYFLSSFKLFMFSFLFLKGTQKLRTGTLSNCRPHLYGFPLSFLNSALQIAVNSLMLMAWSLEEKNMRTNWNEIHMQGLKDFSQYMLSLCCSWWTIRSANCITTEKMF